MRQIEILLYTCPLCNAALICAGVDLSHDEMANHSSVTTLYRCEGCTEGFFSIEKTTVKEKSKFDCLFCHQKTTDINLQNDWCSYQKCLSCKVSFTQEFSPFFEGIKMINMYTTINGSLYVLRQFMDQQKSRIELLPKNLKDTIAAVQEFNFIFPNIRPDNINEKLLTYIIFG